MVGVMVNSGIDRVPYCTPCFSMDSASGSGREPTATHRKTEKERQLATGKGVGVEPNHTTARKPGHLLIIQSPLFYPI
jgi:hypothetical protein